MRQMMVVLVVAAVWCGGTYDAAKGTNFASCEPARRVEVQGTGVAGSAGPAGAPGGSATGSGNGATGSTSR